MLEDNSIGKLGALVLDEIHMIGDPQRGYIMELLVTKILAVRMPIQVASWSSKYSRQIIGMSATMTNVQLLARWINGHYYDSEFRPVPLRDYLVCNVGSIHLSC